MKDPIGFAGGDTNLYSYVGQNPVTFVDPSGLDREIIRSSISGGIPHDTLHIYDPKMPGNSLYIGFGPADGKVKVATNLFVDVPGFVDISELRPKGSVLSESILKSSVQQDSLLLERALDAQRRSIRGELLYNLFSGPYNQNSSRANCRTFAEGL